MPRLDFARDFRLTRNNCASSIFAPASDFRRSELAPREVSIVCIWTHGCFSAAGAFLLATTQTALNQVGANSSSRDVPRRKLDSILLLGVTIASGAIIAGIAAAGIPAAYFFQPAGALIVVGGTIGVMLLTTPKPSLMNSLRRVAELLSAEDVDREPLIEEIISYSRISRRGGLLAMETEIGQIEEPFLRQSLQLALDVGSRAELLSVLENEIRMRERQGESDAKTLEVAGGFAPTIGIIGTVVGLVEVLRHFSNVQSVGVGIGTAFVSTIYGLMIANLVLLPVAHRIRARVADNFELQEMIAEGVLSLFDNLHPSLIRMRLRAYTRRSGRES